MIVFVSHNEYLFPSLLPSGPFQPSPAGCRSTCISQTSEMRLQSLGCTNLLPSQSTFFRQRKAAESARPEACGSGGQPGSRRPSPGPQQTRFGHSRLRDAGRARVHPPRTRASSAPAFLPTPRGPGAAASPSSNSRLHPLSSHFALSTGEHGTRETRDCKTRPGKNLENQKGRPGRAQHMRRGSLRAALPRVPQGAVGAFLNYIPHKAPRPPPPAEEFFEERLLWLPGLMDCYEPLIQEEKLPINFIEDYSWEAKIADRECPPTCERSQNLYLPPKLPFWAREPFIVFFPLWASENTLGNNTANILNVRKPSLYLRSRRGAIRRIQESLLLCWVCESMWNSNIIYPRIHAERNASVRSAVIKKSMIYS